MAEAPAGEECRTCRFWWDALEPEGSDLGRCRRYPPVGDWKRAHGDIWPLVSYAAWCGEYQEAKEED